MRRRGCTTGPCCGSSVVQCSGCMPCFIPETTLTASWTGGSTNTSSGGYYVNSGTATLYYVSTNSPPWQSTVCLPFEYDVHGVLMGWIEVQVNCTSLGTFQCTITEYSNSSCATYMTSFSLGFGYSLGAYTCNPFSIALTANTAVFPGIPNFTITGASPVNCGGCYGKIAGLVSDCCSGGSESGANVVIEDHTTHAVIANVGTTSSLGTNYSVLLPGGGDNYDVLVSSNPPSCSSFASITNVAVACNQTTNYVSTCGYCWDLDGAWNCCVGFTLYGCNAQPIVPANAAELDWTGPTSGNTEFSSSYVNWCTNLTGTYTYSITDSTGRFAALTGQTLVISSPLCSGTAQMPDVTLTPASNYYCLTDATSPGPCAYPLPNTLHCTFANAGAKFFTYSAGNWTVSFTYLTVAYVINLAVVGTMTATANGVGFTCTFTLVACPVEGPFSGTITPSGIGVVLGTGTITE
jgi:hypothetical protein